MFKKNILKLVICMAIVFAMLGQASVSQAADAANNLYANADVKNYIDTKTYPKEDGKVFAGWYKNANFSAASSVRAKNPLGDADAYAKFADEKVLSVKFQLDADLKVDKVKSEDVTTDLHILTSVDSMVFKQVGFDIEINGKKKEVMSNTVYEIVTGYVNEKNENYTPAEAFGTEESIRFMACTIADIPESLFGTEIKVTPKWITMDGTTVTGIPRTLVIYNELQGTYDTTTTFGTLYSAPSTVKVTNKATSWTGRTQLLGANDTGLSYQAVKNEYESTQMILTATKDVNSFELYASDLKLNNSDGTLDDTERLLAENIEVYYQKHVNYDDTTHTTWKYESGSMPDALIPMSAANKYGETKINANQNGNLWITVYVPKDAKAGTYSGDFVLNVNETELVKVPVSVEVMDYTLSDETTARTLFSWRYDRVAPGELDGSQAMMEKYYEFFQDYRISLQSLPLATLSGVEMVEYVEKYYDTLSTYTILSNVGDVSLDLMSNTGIAKDQILALAKASTPDRNLLEKAVFYIEDETDFTREDRITYALDKFNALKKLKEECVTAIEAERTLTYSDYTDKEFVALTNSVKNIPNIVPLTDIGWLLDVDGFDYNETYRSAYVDLLDTICVVYTAWNDEQIEKLQNFCTTNGIAIWWYGSSGAGMPYPNYHIADPNLLSARSVSWLQNKYDIQGNLYWDATAYTDEANVSTQGDFYNEYINIFENPYRSSDKDFQAGDGFLTYPGEAYGVEGPLPSLRMMSIRDGLEEYEMLGKVESKLSEQFGSDIAKTTMDAMFYRMLYSGDRLTTYYNSKRISMDALAMASDGNAALDFANVRKNLLQMAANLENGLGYAMTEVTIDDSWEWIGGDVTASFTCYAQSGATLTINGGGSSGSSYELNLDENGSYATITVTKDGESATYKQYVGKTPSGVNSITMTGGDPVSQSEVVKTTSTYNEEEKSTLIHSFDSYANITGTGLRVSKFLGETKVNTDATYKTEGIGSWMIRPEGDYGKEDGQPWFRMRSMDATRSNGKAALSTFATSDFSGYGKVLMDVYNAGSEATTIKWSFTVYDNTNSAFAVPEVATIKLQPGWNTCEYDLSDSLYDSRFALTQVKYMTVAFEKKESKDDKLPELYFDNLRGVALEGTRTATGNFTDGIKFEQLSDRYLFTTFESANIRLDLSRLAYENTPFATSATLMGFDKYALVGDATGATYPQFVTTYEKTYSAGDILKFWMYVETDEAAAQGKTFRMESYSARGGTANKVYNGACQFNEWVEVTIELGADSNTMWFFANLSDGTPAENSILGDADVTIYMDNFQIVENKWGPVLN